MSLDWNWVEDRQPSQHPLRKSGGGKWFDMTSVASSKMTWEMDVQSQPNFTAVRPLGTIVLHGNVDGELRIALRMENEDALG